MSNQFNFSIRNCIIDLSNSTIEYESHSSNSLPFQRYLGGIGYAADFLLKRMSPDSEALGSENYLCFCAGILSGTNVPFSGRFTVVGKSPLTGTWGESNCGGRFGPELRKAGFDLLSITGQADELSTIIINEEKALIEKTPELKGLDCVETEEKLQEQYGSKFQVVSVGLAGENGVLSSGIVTDKGRIAARSGLGAVMGSKNLKAIAVRGQKKVPIYDAAGLSELRLLLNKRIKKGASFFQKPTLKLSTRFAPWIRRMGIKNYGSLASNSVVIETYKRWGTAAGTAISTETGDAPVKNWVGCHQDFPLKKSVKLTSDNVTQYETKKYACAACPFACGGKMSYQDERHNIKDTHKPEYESLAMFGPNLLNDDLGSIIALNDYCNRQGLDTIDIGSLLGFTFEAFEKGILSEEDLDGLRPIWGDPSTILPLCEKIVRREGIGDILANGLGHATRHFGEKASDIGIHISNQAVAAHDPRFSKYQLLSYKLDPAPGRHTSYNDTLLDISRFSEKFPSLMKDRRRTEFYLYHQLISSLGICQFGLMVGHYPTNEFVNLVTGMDFSPQDLIDVGERIFILKHIFNLREGVNPLVYNKVPKRLVNPTEGGPNSKVTLSETELNIMYEKFLTDLKWDTNSTKPDKNRMNELGLESFWKLIEDY